MGTHVLYEEDGAIRTATVLADHQSSLQVETPHGRRAKIKSAHVLMRFAEPGAGAVAEAAKEIAADLDADFLWEASGDAEFGFEDLAREYFGRSPAPAEAAGVIMKLHDSPMHFYKKGRGRYKPAPADALAAAKTGAERRRREKELQAALVAKLGRFEFPEEMRDKLSMLLYSPDKNTIEWKALDQATHLIGLTGVKLLQRCGAIGSAHDYHFGSFLAEYFPRGTGFAATPPLPQPAGLDRGERHAFSIDDATTTEIDDAFSVEFLDDGTVQVGVHIAAPALGIAPGSELDRVAGGRLSTVYMPGNKITMLPEEVIHHFTLGEARECPALSLYLFIEPQTFAIRAAETRIERVTIAANLCHDELEREFNESTIGSAAAADYPFRRELEFLHGFAGALATARGKGEEDTGRVDYNFLVSDGRVSIRERKRGTPIDSVVSELMILTNSRWGSWLAQSDVAGVYRVQSGGKVRMTTAPGPHQGLGVENYAWSSSPLRRYVDLVNQRQLIALVRGETPPYSRDDERLFTAVRDFEVAYDAYAVFQRHMERYWCMQWLIQEDLRDLEALVLRENLVRIAGLPLVIRVSSLPETPPGTAVRLAIREVDTLDMHVDCRYAGVVEEEVAQGA